LVCETSTIRKQQQQQRQQQQGDYNHRDPSGVSRPSQLVDLILADNYLEQLDPAIVERLVNLQRLDLTCNKLKELPHQLGFLSRISALSLAGNPLTTKFKSSDLNEPKSLLQILRNRAPKEVQSTHQYDILYKTSSDCNDTAPILLVQHLTQGHTTLDLSGKMSQKDAVDAIERLVQELRLSPSIASGITGQLVLDSNQIQSLPEDFLPLLPNLTGISLKKNALSDLPRSLQKSCPKLKELNLANNHLTTESLLRIPGFITTTSFFASSQSLRQLNLSSNRLEGFPVDMSTTGFPTLQVLNLSNNRIRTVSDWKQLPSSLTSLDLSENSVEDMEPLVTLVAADCPELQHLSLMHNQLKCIPPHSGLLGDYNPNLVTFNVRGNPQQAVRSNILERPCADVLKYLVNRMTPEQRQEAVNKINVHARNKARDNTCDHVPAKPMTEPQQQQEAEKAPRNESESSSELLDALRTSILDLENQLEKVSLSQAKRYAMKKSLAMERSKLIREERRLGLRK